jgi:hypothetical protein
MKWKEGIERIGRKGWVGRGRVEGRKKGGRAGRKGVGRKVVGDAAPLMYPL